jgi:hypothetical protein
MINEMDMPDFIIPILYILIGAVIGLGFDWLKVFLKNRRINNSIKTLINLEIEKNKTLLKDFWTIVSKHENCWYKNTEFRYIYLSDALNDVPLPFIIKSAWDNNFNLLPIVYTSEQLKYYWRFYDNLELLKQIKEHLFFLENESQNIRKGMYVSSQKSNDSILRKILFDDDAKSLARRFNKIIEDLIGKDSESLINKF